MKKKTKKTMAMLCMSALVASSLVACSTNGDESKKEDSKVEQAASKDLKGSFLSKFEASETLLKDVKLPTKDYYSVIQGARVVDDKDQKLVVYEFTTKDNKFYNFIAQKDGKEAYTKVAESGSAEKKKTPKKKEYIYDKGVNQTYWMDGDILYSINTAQLNEKEMEKIIDSIKKDEEPKKLLSFNEKSFDYPKYLPKQKDSEPRTVVEFYYMNKDVEVEVGNEFAAVAQTKDGKKNKQQFEEIKEYKKTGKESLPKGHTEDDGHDHSMGNPYYDAFEKLEIKGGEGFIQVFENISGESFVKKGDKYYYIRVEGDPAKKQEKDYFIKETQKIIDGLK